MFYVLNCLQCKNFTNIANSHSTILDDDLSKIMIYKRTKQFLSFNVPKCTDNACIIHRKVGSRSLQLGFLAIRQTIERNFREDSPVNCNPGIQLSRKVMGTAHSLSTVLKSHR